MSKCPFCDKNMINGVCGSCGYREYNSNESEIWGEAVEKESIIIHEEPHYEEKRMNDDKQLGSLWKVLLIITSIFFSPLLGFIASIVLITRPYPSYKSFGIKLLILNIVLLVLRLLLGILALFLNIAFIGTHHILNGVGTLISIL